MTVILLVSLLMLAQAEQRSESGLRYSMVGGGGGKTPMIIFLHGTFGNASYWGAFVTAAQKKGYLAVLPLSTGDGSDDGKSGDGTPRWGRVDIPKLVSLAREMQRKHGADPRRTYIAGFSNGGFYAFETGLRHPEIFTAILCMGGGCSLDRFSEADKSVGCYIVHGTKDTSVGFDSGVKTTEKLKAAGFKDVVFKEKTGQGHKIFFDEIDPFYEWLSKQRRVTVPGGNVALAWQTDLDGAIKKGGRILLYLYSPRDESSDFVDWLETDAFVDEGVVAAAAAFTCVKIDRDATAVPEGLASKTPCAVVFEMEQDKARILAGFRSIGSAKSMVERLKALRLKK